MVMAKNRTAHNRKVCVGPHKIMRKLLYKVKKFHVCIMLNLHRNMPAVEHDAVLIVVHIRRILKSPLISLNCDWNDSVILPCWMIYPAGIALIFHAELTLRITALLCIFSRRNRLGILLWLR